MTDKFRVALSGDFRKADGSPTYPDFDLAPLYAAKGVEVVFLEAANPLRADQLEDFDALILLAHRFTAESVPRSGRLAVVARFGVGYDTVDVDACTEGGYRARHHAGRRASPGRGFDHHVDAGSHRQADDQGPAHSRSRSRLRQALGSHGRRPGRTHARLRRHRQYRGRIVSHGEAVRYALHRS